MLFDSDGIKLVKLYLKLDPSCNMFMYGMS